MLIALDALFEAFGDGHQIVAERDRLSLLSVGSARTISSACRTGRESISAHATSPHWLVGHPTTFRATVTNLLDKRYWVANPSGYVISGAARTALLSMTIDF
ncbi:hypothetical protein [Tardiphaga robiniae]|uniref:hypothetical protein n=1 Tax=Tardiphaga robiniae TaxID=943830 RepID=UPI001FCF25E6|nr:hypothetical protein [Tardiphaga robiniae]